MKIMNKLTDKALFNYTNIFCTLLEFEIYLYITRKTNIISMKTYGYFCNPLTIQYNNEHC